MGIPRARQDTPHRRPAFFVKLRQSGSPSKPHSRMLVKVGLAQSGKTPAGHSEAMSPPVSIADFEFAAATFEVGLTQPGETPARRSEATAAPGPEAELEMVAAAFDSLRPSKIPLQFRREPAQEEGSF